ncbi:hypothetical protein I317_06863 [Kwoniella heveanensis CBS 569]|nr:hypothetical protein I317_06863 [Kwoniella heveanensis CBS 569]
MSDPDPSNPFHVPSTVALGTSSAETGVPGPSEPVPPKTAHPNPHLHLRSKRNGPSTDSPQTTARNQTRFGGLFASLGLASSGTGSPLRHIHSRQPPGRAATSRSQLRHNEDCENTRYETPKKASYGHGSETGTEAGSATSGVWSFAERMKALTLGTPQSQSSAQGTARGKGRIMEWSDDDQSDDGSIDRNDIQRSGNRLMALPDEILLTILLNLPPGLADIHTVSLISRRFYDLSRIPILWMNTFDDEGFRLTEEAKDRGLAVEYPPEGRWAQDGLHWVVEVENEPKAEGDPPNTQWLDSRNHHEDAGDDDESVTVPRPIPIHYPTIVRSRFAFRQALKSAKYKPSNRLLAGHDDTTYCVKETGGWIITGSRDKSIGVWRDDSSRFSLGSGRLHDWPGPSRRTTDVSSSLSSTSDTDSDLDEAARSPTAGPTPRRLGTMPDAHERSILAIDADVNRDGRGTIVTASSDSTVKVWKVNLSEMSASNVTGEICVRPKRPGSRRATGQTEGGPNLEAEKENGTTTDQQDLSCQIRLVSTIQGSGTAVLDVLLTTTYVVTASKDGLVRVYDRRSQSFALLRVLEGHTQSVNSLARSPPGWKSQPASAPDFPSASPSATVGSSESVAEGLDGEYAVSASGDGKWIIWDLKDGIQLQRGGEGRGLACVCWNGDRIVTGDNDKLVKIYSASSGDLIRTFSGHTDLVRSVVVDVENGIVFSGSYDKTIRMWDLKTSECIRVFNQDERASGAGAGAVAFDVEFKVNKLIA